MSCKDHCRYAQYCYQKGWDDLEPEDCAWYYKIEDIMWDAECAKGDYYDPDSEPEYDEDDEGDEE